MNIIELVFLAMGLAMDACAVSICKGLSIKSLRFKTAIIIAAYFGIFQAMMPIIGYLLGSRFEKAVVNIDHWIAFFLLLVIGCNMIKETFDKDEKEDNDMVDFKSMIPLAIATSIDALAVGITFAFLRVNIIESVCLIGIITFSISLLGVYIGKKFGNKYKNKAEIMGGIVLIIIGIKILMGHLLY